MHAHWQISHQMRGVIGIPFDAAPARKKQTAAQKRAPACHKNDSPT